MPMTQLKSAPFRSIGIERDVGTASVLESSGWVAALLGPNLAAFECDNRGASAAEEIKG